MEEKKGIFWIQHALHNRKKGALHRELGIPEGHKIPVSLLGTIKHAGIGHRILNSTDTGRKDIKVTHLLKERAAFAYNVRHRRR